MSDNSIKDITKGQLTLNHLTPIQILHILKRLYGYSYNKIAEGCECSKSQIVFIFQEKYWPSEEVKQKLANFFKVNPLELWK